MLTRFHGGEPGVWSTAHVPSVEDEDARNLHRELRAAKQERNRHTNRIKGLLMSQGIQVERVPKNVSRWLDTVRLWNEEPFPAGLRARIEHEAERRALAEEHVKTLEAEQLRTIRSSEGREGPPPHDAARHRCTKRLALRDGVLRLAGVPESAGDRRLGRARARAASKWE